MNQSAVNQSDEIDTAEKHPRPPMVMAITGASGAVFATRTLQCLLAAGTEVHLTISPSGAAVIEQELGYAPNLRRLNIEQLVATLPAWMDSPSHVRASDDAIARIGSLHYHHYQDYMTPIASGSFRTAAMLACPCSGSTLSGIARAAASNLIQRAAEVHLKEQRKLVLVPRETPLSVFQLENMQRIAAAGGVILPAMPGWYHGVETLGDIVDFVVARILDQVDVDNGLIERWKDS